MALQVQKPDFAHFAPSLRQLNGSGKGRVFEVNAARITLGRSEDNHIVLVDESVSRVHAMIELNHESGIAVFDNQSRNGILINGRKVEASVLKSGDQLQIGSIAFQVLIPSNEEASTENPQASGVVSSGSGSLPRANKRLLLYGVAGLILAGALYMNQMPEEPQKKEAKKTEEGSNVKKEPAEKLIVNSPQDVADPLKNPIETELEKIPWNDTGISESEAYFRRGQRELINKNYQRAINSFELSLSLNANHVEAQASLRDAIEKSEQDAESNFEKATKYYAALQYQRAIYFFQQSQASWGHRPQEPRIKQAEEFIRLARQRLKAAELFP